MIGRYYRIELKRNENEILGTLKDLSSNHLIQLGAFMKSPYFRWTRWVMCIVIAGEAVTLLSNLMVPKPCHASTPCDATFTQSGTAQGNVRRKQSQDVHFHE